MTLYTVTNDNGYYEEFFTLTAAKKAMKEFCGRGFKTKIYSNGDEVPMGEITIKGSNKGFVANSRMTKPNY